MVGYFESMTFGMVFKGEFQDQNLRQCHLIGNAGFIQYKGHHSGNIWIYSGLCIAL